VRKIIGCLVVEHGLVAVLTERYVLEDQDDVNAEKS